MDDSVERMDCDAVLDLVPAYVDGEAGGAAAGVRRHLIDCASCRGAVQEANALRQWFVPTDEVPVPDGFAARVTQAAFAAGGADTLVPRAPQGEVRRFADFAVMLTAVAAAALVVVTLLIATDGPGAFDHSSPVRAVPDLTERLQELERQNADALEAETTEGEPTDTDAPAAPAEGR